MQCSAALHAAMSPRFACAPLAKGLPWTLNARCTRRWLPLQVRRTYKKLALQLHPDKAASAVRLAPRCAGCGSAPFEALAAQGRLQERATWLFKLLGALLE